MNQYNRSGQEGGRKLLAWMQWDLSIELKGRIHISIVRTEGRSQQR